MHRPGGLLRLWYMDSPCTPSVCSGSQQTLDLPVLGKPDERNSSGILLVTHSGSRYENRLLSQLEKANLSHNQQADESLPARTP